MQLTFAEHQQLHELIRIRTGHKLDDNRMDDILRVLKSADVSDSATLFRVIANENSSLWQQLINTVTIGETYFFRNQDQHNALQQFILPQLIEQRRASGYKQLRIWSAGCATGEEPYTLAIQLREIIPDIDQWYITILATDINVTSLEYAKRGFYRARSFRMETRPDIQDSWFIARDGGYDIDPNVRKMVQFAPLNLITDDYPSYLNNTVNMDMIICRNVTIYFEEAMTRQIVNRFHQSLMTDGWLVVGHAEPMASVYREFAPRNYPNAVFYQKSTVVEEPPKPVTHHVRPVLPTVPVPAPVKPAPKQKEEDYLQLAKIEADRENWDLALEHLKKAENQNKMQPQVYYLRALIHLHNGELDTASNSLRRAIYCDWSFALAHYTLGDLFEKQGNHREAVRNWRAAQSAIANLDPHEPLPYGEEMTVEMFKSLLEYRLKPAEK